MFISAVSLVNQARMKQSEGPRQVSNLYSDEKTAGNSRKNLGDRSITLPKIILSLFFRKFVYEVNRGKF